MDKQKLNDFVKHMINDNEDGMQSAFHDYLKGKMRQVIDKAQSKHEDSPMEHTAAE